MPIKEITIQNFKGIDAPVELEIKPITIFVGANSSGKSSCIHALACLSQTAKIPNNSRPLVLDDEYANVHLGRFIEVIHSRTYKDAIGLGINIGEITYPFRMSEKKLTLKKEEGKALFSFKSTLRTQDVNLEHATYTVGSTSFSAKRKDDHFTIAINGVQDTLLFELESAFSITPQVGFESEAQFSKYRPLISLQRDLISILKNTLYLGPFRQSPQRSYPTRGASPKEVGPLGEATVTLIANEIIQKQSRAHIDKIQEWLGQLNLAKKLEVRRIARSELFGVNLTLPDGKSYPLADLGYGLSQVLPVLAQCSFAQKGSTLLFEQPEIHLHTVAAKGLAKIFIDTVKEKDARILIETHSPDLVHQLQRELRSRKIKVEDLAIYKVSRKNEQTNFKKIEIDDDDFDIYENWEDGITR
jgi:predicted ATPase